MFKYFILCNFLFYSAISSACNFIPNFEATGWKIHSSEKFNEIKNIFFKQLESELSSDETQFDMGGPVVTRDTPNKSELLLDVFVFDKITTERDLMFGDYAYAVTTDNERTVVEIRWFDGINRNIVIHSSHLTCFTEDAPFVENSVY